MNGNKQSVLVVADELTIDDTFNVVLLKHPGSGKTAQYALSKDYSKIFEVLRHKAAFGSWFVGEEVISDGSLLMMTPVDPVFLVLPYLRKHAKGTTSRFNLLEDILHDEEYVNAKHLCKCTNHNDLENVTEFKGDEDFKVYRYSEQKTHGWLQKKVSALAGYLEKSGIHVAMGAKSSHFIRSNKDASSKDDYTRYAFGIVSTYLEPDLAAESRQLLRISDEEDMIVIQPPLKKAKTEGGSIEPLDDYSKGLRSGEPVAKKPTANEKRFAKVDKTGMKSIASFFSPKSQA